MSTTIHKTIYLILLLFFSSMVSGNAVTAEPIDSLRVPLFDSLVRAVTPNNSAETMIATPPTVSHTGIIYIAIGNQIYAYSSTGQLQPGWPITAAGTVEYQVELSRDHETLYAGTNNGILHAIHSADSGQSGEPQWQLPVGGQQALAPPLVDSHGYINLGSLDKNFYSVNPAGQIRWSFQTISGIAQKAILFGDYTLKFTSLDQQTHTVRAGVIGPHLLQWQSMDDSLLDDYLDTVPPDYQDYVATGWDVIEMFWVGRLFEGLLQRRPDRETLTFWTYALLPESGATLEEVASAFLQSDTGVALYGHLGNAAYLQTLYREILGITDYVNDTDYAQRFADLNAGILSRGAAALLFTNSQYYSALIDQRLLRVFEIFYLFCLESDCEFLLDEDNDGLSDQWEIAQFGDTTSQSGDDDADGDGISNYQEYLAGTEAVAHIDTPKPPAIMQVTPASDANVITSDKTGKIPGQFRVDEQGSATYSIPLQTPTGTAGVAPELSLNYASQSGNGLMGRGWTMGGLSAISRCRQTLHQDGKAKPITWSDNDRFCLDGQRLVAVDGDYGAGGTTYKTEIDSYITVTSVGGSHGHPQYFTVIRKDGSISYYGGSSDARQVFGPHVMTWAINRFEDNMGNGIDYRYYTVGGHRIKDIAYAYGRGDTAHARLVFSYQSGRPDPIAGHIAGYAFKQTQRLKNITVYSSGADGVSATEQEIVREYELSYRAVDNSVEGLAAISQLDSIEACATNSANIRVCLPATTFTWSNTQPIDFSVSAITTINLSPLLDRGILDYKSADINGDGAKDIVWMQWDRDGESSDHQLQYAVSDENTVGLVHGYFTGGQFELTFNENVGDEKVKFEIIDYNVDGRHDVIVYSERAGRWMVYLAKVGSGGKWQLSSTAIPTYLFSESIQFVDVTSDGLIDAVKVFNDTLYASTLELNTSVPESSAQRYSFSAMQIVGTLPNNSSASYSDHKIVSGLDFNADGIGDIHVTSAVGTSRYRAVGVLLNGTGNADIHYSHEDINGTGSYTVQNNLKSVDFNGDGLSDQLYQYHKNSPHGETWFYRLNTGTGFSQEASLASNKTIGAADYNADGYPDIYWHGDHYSHILVRLWNPSTNGFDSVIRVETAQVERYQIEQLDDFNGDGVIDYLQLVGNFLRVRPGTRGAVIANHITMIRDGFGIETHIDYGNLSSSGHYQRVALDTEKSCTRQYPGGFGRGDYCAATSGDFYSALNGDWDLPAGSDSFGKTAPVFEFNSTLPVVKRVRSSAPSAGFDPGGVDNTALSAISYYYGEAKFQASGRGFLGFHSLRTVDEQTGMETLTVYRQDYPFTGFPLSTQVRTSDGQLLKQSENTWKLQGWNGDQAQLPPLPYRPYMASSIETQYATRIDIANGINFTVSDNVLRSIKTQSDYDASGNPELITATTYNNNGVVVSQHITDNHYGDEIYQLHGHTFSGVELGRLSRTTVTSKKGTLSHQRTSAFEYYANGLLEKEIIEPDQLQYRLATTYHYDDVGNKTRVEQTGQGISGRISKIYYDDLGRFSVERENSYGQTTQTILAHNALGKPTLVEDINGVRTTLAYSAFGAKRFEYTDTGSWMEMLSRPCDNLCLGSGAYKTTVTEAGGSESIHFYDKLGRTVREAERQFDGSWGYTDTEFDNLGRVKRQSEPDNRGLHSEVTPLYWTEFDYDPLGRVVYTEMPGIDNPATAAYDGLTTVTTNSAGQSKTEINNVLGELVEVIDNIGGRVTNHYDANGQLIATTQQGNGDVQASTMQMCYDGVGRKIAMRDPDKGGWVTGAMTQCPSRADEAVVGWWVYSYNGAGELVKQIDAKGQHREISYDSLGRMVSRIDRRSNASVESNTAWSYNNASSGTDLGSLMQVEDSISGYQRTVNYDVFGRTVQINTSLGDSEHYYEKVTYDEFGRRFQVYDMASNGEWNHSLMQNIYNPYGYLEQVADGRVVNSERTVYYTVRSMDLRGNVTEYLNGNGITSVRTYDTETGRLTDIVSDLASGFGQVQKHHYSWDDLANLISRDDNSGNKSLHESFSYDELNRLQTAQVSGRALQQVNYDSSGNIILKTGVGSYQYSSHCNNGGYGPHAVCETTGGVSYDYDANGNMVQDSTGRSLQYTTFDKPNQIEKGSHTTRFKYDPDRSRYQRQDTDKSGGITTTVYIGSVEKIRYPDGSEKFKRYLPGGALITMDTVGVQALAGADTQYFYKDHLGSLDVITDDTGFVVQSLSFDAWGARRSALDWSQMTLSEQLAFDHRFTTRGFTGHEMLDEVGLVHMNGRIYDARLGRFLQADPFIDGLNFTQGYNRYSYVYNNPLNATDPTGHFIFTLGAIALAAGGVIEGAVAIGVVFGLAGFSDALIQGASFADALKAGIYSGVSAAAFTSVGAGFDFASATWGETAMLGLQFGAIGGITSVLQGGKFGHGFISAGVGAFTGKGLAGSFGKAIGGGGRMLVQMVVAGTLSDATGGKFANGAAYTAFSAAVRASAGNVARSKGSDASVKKTDLTEKQKQAYLKSAKKYLQGSEKFRKIYKTAMSGDTKIKIVTNDPLGSWYDHETKTVFWDPTLANDIDAGIASSAVTLGHELSHAARHIAVGTAQFDTELNTPTTVDYSPGQTTVRFGVSPEEIRATVDEGIIAKQLGEPIRSNYRDAGDAYVTDSTFSCYKGAKGCY
jgi:RHS repeat-associated protein